MAASATADWNTEAFWKTATTADVSHCLADGADPKARDKDGATPLHHAAAFGTTPAVVTLLLAAGADLEARLENGRTPLHVAAGNNTDPEIVTALLAAGANPAARDTKGRIPWDLIKANSPLKGSDAYWRLNEACFRQRRQTEPWRRWFR